jgi:hypothetical protein
MRSLRSALLSGIAVLAISAVGAGVFTSSAAAQFHCTGGVYDGCAFANANYEGGTYHWRIESGYFVHSFTGLSSVSGCTTGSFNDCVSSLDNEGPYPISYHKDAGCSGGEYYNEIGTGTSYVGEFWNDTFSSLRENGPGSC